MRPLWHPGFAALWHPELAASALLLGVAYLQIVVGPLRGRFPGAERPAPERIAAFLLGLGGLYGAQGSPLELLANAYLLSARVLQTLLLVFWAAPLILLGTPAWLYRPLAANLRFLRRAVQRYTRPVWAVTAFALLFALWMVPPLTQAALTNPWLALLQHTLTFLAALALWWPVARGRLTPAAQLTYLVVTAFSMMPVALTLAFARRPLYPAYALAARWLPWLSPLGDQRLAAVIMVLGMMAALGIAALAAFLDLARRAEGLAPG